MILADTTIWIDHFRSMDDRLSRLLGDGRIVTHPFIVGEIALGSLRNRAAVIAALGDLGQVTVADPAEVLAMIEAARLFGTGLGYVDAHLLASARLTPGTTLWTRDRRLQAAAEGLGVAEARGCRQPRSR